MQFRWRLFLGAPQKTPFRQSLRQFLRPSGGGAVRGAELEGRGQTTVGRGSARHTDRRLSSRAPPPRSSISDYYRCRNAPSCVNSAPICAFAAQKKKAGSTRTFLGRMRLDNARAEPKPNIPAARRLRQVRIVRSLRRRPIACHREFIPKMRLCGTRSHLEPRTPHAF
jgi:hypothetical protein